MKTPPFVRRISSTSIIFKILLAYSLPLIIFLGGMFLAFLLDIYGLLKERDILMEDEYAEKLERVALAEHRDLYNIAIDIHNRNSLAWWLRDLAETADPAEREEIGERIVSYMDPLPTADRDLLDVILIPREGEPWHSAFRGNRSMRPHYDFFGDPSFSRAMGAEEFFLFRRDDPSRYLTAPASPVISVLSKVYDPAVLPQRQPIGYLLMNLSPRIFLRELERSRLKRNGEYLLFSPEGEILFSSDPELNGAAMAWRSGEEADRRGEYLIRSRNLGETRMELVSLVSLGRIKAPLNRLLRKMILLALGGFLINFLTAFWLLRVGSRRFYLLLDAFDRARLGELEIRLPVTVEDEIGRLQGGFNRMCSDLRSHIDRVYAAEIRRKDMENRYLQTQINPHFLYNTLEQMRSRSLRAGDAELSRMITLLGELLRWSFRSSESIVRVEDELEHTFAYLEIQRLRLGEALTVETEVDEAILDYGIPKMILQPLVENAVSHGIGGRRGRVRLEGRFCGQDIRLRIEDNGRGMDEARAAAYLEREEGEAEKTGDSIGIRNVNQRLRLLFGEAYSLSFTAVEGDGTRVTVRIPRMDLKKMRALCSELY